MEFMIRATQEKRHYVFHLEAKTDKEALDKILQQYPNIVVESVKRSPPAYYR